MLAVTYKDINPNPTNKYNCVILDVDCINASLYNLFLTEKGSDLFRPGRGLNITSWLFAPYNDQIGMSYQNEIMSAIQVWEPRIKSSIVEIVFLNNKLQVIVNYTLNNTKLNKYFQFKFVLEK